MTPKVFIDGEVGTTGLQIRERLVGRSDLQLISIDPDKRKDPVARAAMLNSADAVILCLPDEASKEAVSLIENPAVKVIDASTAFRTDVAWTYGFAELDGEQRGRIAAAKRISNPGCYATGAMPWPVRWSRPGSCPEISPSRSTPSRATPAAARR